MYAGIKADIERVFHWLQGTDETQWEAQSALLSDAISDARLMAFPLTRADKTGIRSQEPPAVLPGTSEISTALPHLREMFRAVQHRNRAAALESGRAALSSLT
jgi:hypothetical protein